MPKELYADFYLPPKTSECTVRLPCKVATEHCIHIRKGTGRDWSVQQYLPPLALMAHIYATWPPNNLQMISDFLMFLCILGFGGICI